VTLYTAEDARAVAEKAKAVATEVKIKNFKEVVGRQRRVLKRHGL